jgi:hypothetical protein
MTWTRFQCDWKYMVRDEHRWTHPWYYDYSTDERGFYFALV